MIQQKEQERLGQESEKKEQNFQTQHGFIFESNSCDQLVIYSLKLSFLKKYLEDPKQVSRNWRIKSKSTLTS
jgi:hypothetical protein